MEACTRGSLRAMTFACVLGTVGCTSDTGSSESADETTPNATISITTTPDRTSLEGSPETSALAPSEMCDSDGVVAVAAFDLTSGALKWTACSLDEGLRRSVLEASEEVVYLEIIEPNTGTQQLSAYDVVDGTELPDGGPAGSKPILPDRTVAGQTDVVVDGIRVEGGQDDPTTAVDDATGDVLWTQPGSPAYDDVWAVGDGAVYVTNHRTASGLGELVAYELTSGDVRWRIDPAPADIRPWHADDARLFAIWTNLAVISTDDGSTIWQTQYPDSPFPRMTGVGANSDTVFVAFSSIPSGGD